MIRRLLPHPTMSLLLLLVWLLLSNSIAFGHWLLGGLLGSFCYHLRVKIFRV